MALVYHDCSFCDGCGECLEHDYCICCLVCDSPFCRSPEHKIEVSLMEDDD